MLLMAKSHIGMNLCLLFQEYLIIFLHKDISILVQIRRIYYILHIALYHSFLVEIHLYEGYFNVCYVIVCK
jgi:hypothetical protein